MPLSESRQHTLLLCWTFTSLAGAVLWPLVNVRACHLRKYIFCSWGSASKDTEPVLPVLHHVTQAPFLPQCVACPLQEAVLCRTELLSTGNQSGQNITLIIHNANIWTADNNVNQADVENAVFFDVPLLILCMRIFCLCHGTLYCPTASCVTQLMPASVADILC